MFLVDSRVFTKQGQGTMRLKGSCHCRAVLFECDSKHPCPYQLCYCSICRKTQGAGGYSINLSGDAATLSVQGRENTAIYNAKINDSDSGELEVSPAQRVFCKSCGSFLWLEDPRWPELLHPFASAIDSELPVPPERTHIMLESKPKWVEPCFGPNDKKYEHYPEESIAQWHQRLGLEK